MISKVVGSKLVIAALLVAVGFAGRLLPHAWNVTPLTAIVIFAASYLGWRYSAPIFFSILVFTDLIIGVYDWRVMLAVYLSYASAVPVGVYVGKHKRLSMIVGGSLISSVLFFIITNFAVWQFSSLYEHSFAGLVQCYTMALPFFRNSLVGDLFYTTMFFGFFEFCVRRVFKNRPAMYYS